MNRKKRKPAAVLSTGPTRPWLTRPDGGAPGFVLLIALYAVIGPKIPLAMAVFGVLIAPSFFRLVRSLVQGIRHELYVDAARVAGLSDRRIISRHVLRAVRGPIIVHASFVLTAGIAIEAGLQFLGLGNPRDPSWGGMLQDAFGSIYVNGIAVVWPALLIGVTTLCLVLLGNVVRDVLQGSSSRPAALKPAVVRQLGADQGPVAQQESGAPSTTAPLLRVRDLALGYPASSTTVNPVVHGSTWWCSVARSTDWWGSPAPASPRLPSPSWASCRPRRSSCAARSSSTVGTCWPTAARCATRADVGSPTSRRSR